MKEAHNGEELWIKDLRPESRVDQEVRYVGDLLKQLPEQKVLNANPVKYYFFLRTILLAPLALVRQMEYRCSNRRFVEKPIFEGAKIVVCQQESLFRQFEARIFDKGMFTTKFSLMSHYNLSEVTVNFVVKSLKKAFSTENEVYITAEDTAIKNIFKYVLCFFNEQPKNEVLNVLSEAEKAIEKLNQLYVEEII